MDTHSSIKKIVSTLGVGAVLLSGVPLAQAEPLTVGCSPIVSENIGFDDRDPGWINRYADTPVACQAQEVTSGLQVGVPKPVTYDFDRTARLQRDVLQDIVNHVNAPGREYKVSESIAQGEPQTLESKAMYTFPSSSDDRDATNRQDVYKDSLEDYLRSVGAEPYVADTGSSAASVIRAVVYPAPGYEVTLSFLYHLTGTDTDSDAHRGIWLYTDSDFVGDPGIPREDSQGNSSPEYPQDPIIAK